jgi:hypothetical protein
MKPDSGGGAIGDVMMPTGTEDPTAMMTEMMATMAPFLAVFGVMAIGFFAFMIFIQWKIFSKAGHPGALALLNLLLLIPLVNIVGGIVMLVVWVWFAFSEWPALKRAQQAPQA